jgi:hypothetical protein
MWFLFDFCCNPFFIEWDKLFIGNLLLTYSQTFVELGWLILGFHPMWLGFPRAILVKIARHGRRQANQNIVTVEGIIANVDSSLSQSVTDCTNRSSINPDVSAPSSANLRHNFLAEYRDTDILNNDAMDFQCDLTAHPSVHVTKQSMTASIDSHAGDSGT